MPEKIISRMSLGLIGLLLIVINLIVSYRGFKDPSFFSTFSFNVEKILKWKEYRRVISSGFLHVNWLHLLFNMIALFSFSKSVESAMGPFNYFIIYFVSLIGGNLFCLYIHRNHGDYEAVGASGAVSGIIFSSIALFPDMRLGILFLPIAIPGWLFGFLFVLISIYGIRSRRDNIGHEAHLGGALIGMITSLIIYPGIIMYNYIPILLVTVPSLIFIIMIIKNPAFLLVDNLFFKAHRHQDIEDKYNAKKKLKQKEIDKILEKIHKNGIESLSKKEKEILDHYSKVG